jgi:hypothetical protein
MFGSDYLLGYSQGRNSAEDERQTTALTERVIYGRRTVQVDQSYLDQLRRGSDHNYEVGAQAQRDAQWWEDKARQFRDEALHWKDRALRGEADANTARAQIAVVQTQLAQEQAAHRTTRHKEWGLNLFRVMATWLIDAHLAGRSARPAFAEICDMAKLVTDAIERGEPFQGYRDEPEKIERLRALVNELLQD